MCITQARSILHYNVLVDTNDQTWNVKKKEKKRKKREKNWIFINLHIHTHIENDLKTSTKVLLHLQIFFFFSSPLSYTEISLPLPTIKPRSPSHVLCSLDLSRFSIFFLFLSLVRSFYLFRILLLTLLFLLSVLPLLASQKNSLKRPAIKWQPLLPSTISSGTRHCYVATSSLPLCFLTFSLFSSLFHFPFCRSSRCVTWIESVVVQFAATNRFDFQYCASHQKTVVPMTTTRQFIDPRTRYSQEWYSKLHERIARFLVRNFAPSRFLSLSFCPSPSLSRALSLSLSLYFSDRSDSYQRSTLVSYRVILGVSNLADPCKCLTIKPVSEYDRLRGK